MGLAREGYASASKLNEIIKGAFANVQLPKFTPHAFRKILAKYGDKICTSMEQRKTWSMNYGPASLGGCGQLFSTGHTRAANGADKGNVGKGLTMLVLIITPLIRHDHISVSSGIIL